MSAPDATLFRLSYPLFLQSLAMFAVMVADMMIWSAHAPETAAALSVAGQVFRVVVELSALMGAGALIVIARSLGAGDAAAARRAAETACLASAALGLVTGAALALIGPQIVGLMAPPPEMEADAAIYLRLAGAASVFLFFGATAVSCLRAFGLSRLVMLLGLGGAALYVTLSYTLVLGAGPVPPGGAGGAGLAALFTRIAVALALIVVIARVLGLRMAPLRLARRMREARAMAGLAAPSIADFIAYGFYQMALLGLIAALGEAAVLSRGYVMIAMAFLTLVIMAVCQGGEVRIGWRLGRGDRAGAQSEGWRAAWIAGALATACAVAIWMGAAPFIGLFSDDPEIHALSRRLLALTILLQPCFAVNMILFHALRAAHDARWPVAVSQGLSWGLGLPLAWALCGPLGFGVAGVWGAMIVEELAKAAAMAWRWRRTA